MYEIRFNVDTSVWQEGITFGSGSVASAPASFAAELNKAAIAAEEKREVVSAAPVPAVEVKPLLPLNLSEEAGELPVLEQLPAAPASAAAVKTAAKPGDRFEQELNKTGFSVSSARRSPYNMSAKRAEEREKHLAAAKTVEKTLKGVKDEQVFPLDKAARFTAASVKTPYVPQAEQRAKRERKLTPADVSAITASVGKPEGYPRENIPSFSNAQTSAAASWFPEAMTQQLDKYEAMRKIQAAEASAARSADLSV